MLKKSLTTIVLLLLLLLVHSAPSLAYPNPPIEDGECPPMCWCPDPVYEGMNTECWWDGEEWVVSNYIQDPWLYNCYLFRPVAYVKLPLIMNQFSSQ